MQIKQKIQNKSLINKCEVTNDYIKKEKDKYASE